MSSSRYHAATTEVWREKPYRFTSAKGLLHQGTCDRVVVEYTPEGHIDRVEIIDFKLTLPDPWVVREQLNQYKQAVHLLTDAAISRITTTVMVLTNPQIVNL